VRGCFADGLCELRILCFNKGVKLWQWFLNKGLVTPQKQPSTWIVPCFVTLASFCSYSSFCFTDIEYLMVSCRPFYLPRAFSSVIIMAVYIPPQANATLAFNELYGAINKQTAIQSQHFWWPATLTQGDLKLSYLRAFRVAQRSKALHQSTSGVTTDLGSIQGCITTGCDRESHRAAHNWPTVVRFSGGFGCGGFTLFITL
jgi:hypothetical protein